MSKVASKAQIEGYLALGGVAGLGAGLTHFLLGQFTQLTAGPKSALVGAASGLSAFGGLMASDAINQQKAMPSTQELLIVVVISLVAGAASSGVANRMVGNDDMMKRLGSSLVVALVAGAGAAGGLALSAVIPPVIKKK